MNFGCMGVWCCLYCLHLSKKYIYFHRVQSGVHNRLIALPCPPMNSVDDLQNIEEWLVLNGFWAIAVFLCVLWKMLDWHQTAWLLMALKGWELPQRQWNSWICCTVAGIDMNWFHFQAFDRAVGDNSRNRFVTFFWIAHCLTIGRYYWWLWKVGNCLSVSSWNWSELLRSSRHWDLIYKFDQICLEISDLQVSQLLPDLQFNSRHV